MRKIVSEAKYNAAQKAQAMIRNRITIDDFKNESREGKNGNSMVSLLILLGSIIFSTIAHAQTWQATLEHSFDYVETFDQLQDWSGKKGTSQVGDVPNTIYPNDFPKNLNGESSIWEYYSYWSNEVIGDWIKNHGPDNVWKKRGKSLCIDYNCQKGPSRLGFHIGDSPDDGYFNEVYVFFMNKYHKDFFPKANNQYFKWVGFLKTFEIATGFRNIWNWGTLDEQSTTDHTVQVDNVYGMNFIVMNMQGISDEAGIRHERCHYNVFIANADGKHYYPGYEVIAPGTSLNQPILDNQWFAIEYHFLKSNPAGSSNGLIEIWIYDQYGSVLNCDVLSDIINFKDGLSSYNHSYNKLVWGGNRDYYIQKDFLEGKICTANFTSDVLMVTDHLRETGDYLNIYSKDGEVPQPLKNEKGYYVIKINNNEIRVCHSYEDAVNNKYIDLTTKGSGIVYISCLSHLYIDDIIVNKSRIGPKYFALLNGNSSDTIPPDPPSEVTVREPGSQQPDHQFTSPNSTVQTTGKNDRANLSNVRVYLDQPAGNRENWCVVFDHLMLAVTIKIFDRSDQLIYKIENYQKSIFYWYGFDLKGNKAAPGDYRYEITCGVEAVAGKIYIE